MCWEQPWSQVHRIGLAMKTTGEQFDLITAKKDHSPCTTFAGLLIRAAPTGKNNWWRYFSPRPSVSRSILVTPLFCVIVRLASIYFSTLRTTTLVCWTQHDWLTTSKTLFLFLYDLRNTDALEYAKQQRPNSTWTVHSVTTTSLYTNPIPVFHVGCCTNPLPYFIKNNQSYSHTRKRWTHLSVHRQSMLFSLLGFASRRLSPQPSNPHTQALPTKEQRHPCHRIPGDRLQRLGSTWKCLSSECGRLWRISVSTLPCSKLTQCLHVPMCRIRNLFENFSSKPKYYMLVTHTHTHTYV